MAVTFSGTDQQLYDSVRNFLGGVDDKFLKDGVIDEQKDRIVVPFIDRNIDESKYAQSDIDNAIVAYTADRAFNSVQLKSTVSGGGLTTNYATEQYRREIRQRSSEALGVLGLSPPSTGPVPFSESSEGMLRDSNDNLGNLLG